MTNEDIKRLVESKYNINIESIEKSDESTDGNVYILLELNTNTKYVVKIYTDRTHADSMAKLHINLKEYGLKAPQIIKNIRDEVVTIYEDKYIICYSFVNGKQLNQVELTNEIIITIAEYLRKLHRISDNRFNLKNIPFDISSDRFSILHFDATKHNIFIDEENQEICFIDFDDAKFGQSVCDVAIAITNLFISRASGVNKEGIDLFINLYYKDDELLKQKELPIIKKAALLWLNSIIDNPNFDASTKSGLENKIEIWGRTQFFS